MMNTFRQRIKAFLLCGDEERHIDYYRSFLDCLPKDALILGIRQDLYRSDSMRIFVASMFFPQLPEGAIPPTVHEYCIRTVVGSSIHEVSEWRWTP